MGSGNRQPQDIYDVVEISDSDSDIGSNSDPPGLHEGRRRMTRSEVHLVAYDVLAAEYI